MRVTAEEALPAHLARGLRWTAAFVRIVVNHAALAALPSPEDGQVHQLESLGKPRPSRCLAKSDGLERRVWDRRGPHHIFHAAVVAWHLRMPVHRARPAPISLR